LGLGAARSQGLYRPWPSPRSESISWLLPAYPSPLASCLLPHGRLFAPATELSVPSASHGRAISAPIRHNHAAAVLQLLLAERAVSILRAVSGYVPPASYMDAMACMHAVSILCARAMSAGMTASQSTASLVVWLSRSVSPVGPSANRRLGWYPLSSVSPVGHGMLDSRCLIEICLTARDARQHMIEPVTLRLPGISPHWDGAVFAPIIATLSLGGPCVMTFRRYRAVDSYS
jgi:hypothetical protein